MCSADTGHIMMNEFMKHDDVIKWKHFPRYYLYVFKLVANVVLASSIESTQLVHQNAPRHLASSWAKSSGLHHPRFHPLIYRQRSRTIRCGLYTLLLGLTYWIVYLNFFFCILTYAIIYVLIHHIIFYTPATKLGGYIGFTLSVRLSVNLSCPPCSIYSSGWILSIFGTNDH